MKSLNADKNQLQKRRNLEINRKSWRQECRGYARYLFWLTIEEFDEGQRDYTMGRPLALHTGTPVVIPRIIYRTSHPFQE